MTVIMRKLLLVALFWATAATATTFPDYTSTTVNDFADLLDPPQEQALAKQLSQLESETGVEMTVVTLATQGTYAPDLSLEAFATQLFDRWGIGDAARNDGILVLILREDRTMRLELGKAFGRDWDDVATDVVDNHFVSAFAKNDYPAGIMNGTNAVLTKIVTPFLAGSAAPDGESDNTGWILAAMGAFFAFVFGRQKISDGFTRLRKCPACGQRTLRSNRTVTQAASTSASGRGIHHIQCTNCDHSSEAMYTIARISNRTSGGFGGGSSGGGGASGKW